MKYAKFEGVSWYSSIPFIAKLLGYCFGIHDTPTSVSAFPGVSVSTVRRISVLSFTNCPVLSRKDSLSG